MYTTSNSLFHKESRKMRMQEVLSRIAILLMPTFDVSSLSDELWLCILATMTKGEVHNKVSRVCKKWHQLSLSPKLVYERCKQSCIQSFKRLHTSVLLQQSMMFENSQRTKEIAIVRYIEMYFSEVIAHLPKYEHGVYVKKSSQSYQGLPILYGHVKHLSYQAVCEYLKQQFYPSIHDEFEFSVLLDNWISQAIAVHELYGRYHAIFVAKRTEQFTISEYQQLKYFLDQTEYIAQIITDIFVLRAAIPSIIIEGGLYAGQLSYMNTYTVLTPDRVINMLNQPEIVEKISSQVLQILSQIKDFPYLKLLQQPASSMRILNEIRDNPNHLILHLQNNSYYKKFSGIELVKIIMLHPNIAKLMLTVPGVWSKAYKEVSFEQRKQLQIWCGEDFVRNPRPLPFFTIASHASEKDSEVNNTAENHTSSIFAIN